MTLPLFHLLKVSLHFCTYQDVINFICINNKCHDTIRALHVNPWFKTKESIISYAKHFKPNTLNCCYEHFKSNEIPEEINFIKNINFVSEDDAQDTLFGSQCNFSIDESFPLNKITKFIFLDEISNFQIAQQFFTKNLSKFTHLHTVEALSTFISLIFSSNISLSCVVKKIIVHEACTFGDSVVELFEHLVHVAPTSLIIFISSSVTTNYSNLLEHLNIKYYSNIVSDSTKQSCTICEAGMLCFQPENCENYNTFNDVIDKCYATNCDIQQRLFFENMDGDKITWVLPHSVDHLSLCYIENFECDFGMCKNLNFLGVKQTTFPINASFEKLILEDCNIKLGVMEQDVKEWKPQQNLQHFFPNLQELIFKGVVCEAQNNVIPIASLQLKKVEISNNKKPLSFSFQVCEELILRNSDHLRFWFESSMKKLFIRECSNITITGHNFICDEVDILSVNDCSLNEVSISKILLNNCSNSNFIFNQLNTLQCMSCSNCNIQISYAKYDDNGLLGMESSKKIIFSGNLQSVDVIELNNCEYCTIPIDHKLALLILGSCENISFKNEIKSHEICLKNNINYIPINFMFVEILTLLNVKNICFNNYLNGIKELFLMDCQNIKANLSTLTTLYVTDSFGIIFGGVFEQMREFNLLNCYNCIFPQCNNTTLITISNPTHVIIGDSECSETNKHLVVEINKQTKDMKLIEKIRNVKFCNIELLDISSKCFLLRELEIIDSNGITFNQKLHALTKLEATNSNNIVLVSPSLSHLKLTNSPLSIYSNDLTYIELDETSFNESFDFLKETSYSLKELHLNNIINKHFICNKLSKVHMTKCSNIQLDISNDLNELQLNKSSHIKIYSRAYPLINNQIDCVDIELRQDGMQAHFDFGELGRDWGQVGEFFGDDASGDDN